VPLAQTTPGHSPPLPLPKKNQLRQRFLTGVLELVHSWGLVHRLVDNRKAGWVKHWRQIAAEHSDG
ncbi:hypothetical protein ACGF7V_36030, partial [Streptomyces sp. NPDC047725]